MSREAQGRITVRIRNSLRMPRIVVLEPWSSQHTLASEQAFDIVADGDLSLPIEVELFEDTIIVHGLDSAGSTLRVFSDGVELDKSE
jgi:hypothetical protein